MNQFEQNPEETPHIESVSVNRRGFLKLSAIAALLTGANGRPVTADEVKKILEGRENHDLHELIEKSWEVQNSAYEKIAEIGMQKFYENLPDKDEAFFDRKERLEAHGMCACCSDEGNRKYSKNGRNMRLMRTPGSGMLHAVSRDDKDPFAPDFIDALAEELEVEGVTVVTGHAGCGAAKAVWKERIKQLRAEDKMAEAEQLEKKGSDAFASEWADAVASKVKEKAQALGVAHANEIKSDFIKKLDRPEQIHVARAIYVTDTNDLDASYEGLPQGFVEYTGKAPLKTVLAHVDVLRNIAFDPDHAFGTKFSEKPEEQFLICCVTEETPEKLNILKAHAAQAVKGLPADVQRKIRIDGFVR